MSAYRKVSAVLIASAVLAACGGSGGGNATVPPPPPPTTTIPTITVDLADYVTNTLPYVASFTEGYDVPSAADLDEFDALLLDFLAGRLTTAANNAAALNFELVQVIDSAAANNELYCLRERQLNGQGFYCVDFVASDPQHISAPHPLADLDTNHESVTVMRGTNARYLSLATSHRCANAASSACSGTTTACGPSAAYKVSDAAHNVNSYFHRFGVAVHDDSTAPVTIQLHGCGSGACPSNEDNGDVVARVSAGTTANLPATERVNRLNDELNQRLMPLQLGMALSCSEMTADKRLCGTTNPLGRYINGQAMPCENPATDFDASRWLHVEQNRNLRVNDGAGDAITPELLIEAINATKN